MIEEGPLKILVFVKAVEDTKIPLEYSRHTGELIGDWNVWQLNPADRKAIDIALKVKKGFPGAHITLIHLGPLPAERWVREGIALGADEGLRIWEDNLDNCSVESKALIFAEVARVLGFDIILTGSKSDDTMHGQMGFLLRSHLDVPIIGSVVDVSVNREEGTVTALRTLSKGYREKVECGLPLVITVEEGESNGHYASLAGLLTAYEGDIPCWDLAEIGIPAAMIREKDRLLSVGPLQFPRPRLKTFPAPDSALPAFERIKKLLEGTIKLRAGKVVKDDEDGLTEELFQVLLNEGWLDHLRKQD